MEPSVLKRESCRNHFRLISEHSFTPSRLHGLDKCAGVLREKEAIATHGKFSDQNHSDLRDDDCETRVYAGWVSICWENVHFKSVIR